LASGGQLYQLVGTSINVDPWSGLITGIVMFFSLFPSNLLADTIAWTFFVMFFYVFVTIFGLNVVFAIIVDTFGSMFLCCSFCDPNLLELRENRMKARNELDNSCFICSIERDTFIHSGQGMPF
jgi:hypothetical protein